MLPENGLTGNGLPANGLAANGTATWLRRFHGGPGQVGAPGGPADPGGQVRLVCFPHAGGSASYYFPLSAAMPPWVEVLAVQYAGRQDRRKEPPIVDIGELADRVAGALRPLSDRRLALFGHSMGAVVAYEVARRLDGDLHVEVEMLFASGRRAPSRYRDEENVHTLDDDGIVAEISRLDGTDPRLLADPEVREMVLPAVRSDYQAIGTYRHLPGSTVRCPVTVLVGDADPHTTLEEARAWAEHTIGGCAVRVYPGGHFYLRSRLAEVVDTVCGQLANR